MLYLWERFYYQFPTWRNIDTIFEIANIVADRHNVSQRDM